MVLHLNLMTFKTQPCKILAPHNSKKCYNYHEGKIADRRRPPINYISELCPQYFDRGFCDSGDACYMCHNRIEDFYHPEKYKAKFCSTYPHKTSSCDYGEMCSFAHSEGELTVDILDKMNKDNDFFIFHYKTVWCPFSDQAHA